MKVLPKKDEISKTTALNIVFKSIKFISVWDRY